MHGGFAARGFLEFAHPNACRSHRAGQPNSSLRLPTKLGGPVIPSMPTPRCLSALLLPTPTPSSQGRMTSKMPRRLHQKRRMQSVLVTHGTTSPSASRSRGRRAGRTWTTSTGTCSTCSLSPLTGSDLLCRFTRATTLSRLRSLTQFGDGRTKFCLANWRRYTNVNAMMAGAGEKGSEYKGKWVPFTYVSFFSSWV